jgi:uncharacterized pyridoxal phosphate-containing UPF0001 family protein
MKSDCATDMILDNYRQFINDPKVQSFKNSGGKIHIATEGRTNEQIKSLQAEGHVHFSEKYVQEVSRKWKEDLKHGNILHGYGYLQSNKSRRACSLFDVIESIGRDVLVDKLAKLKDNGCHVPPIYIQVNVGAEPQKSGYLIDEVDDAIERSWQSGLHVIGVMAIPPRNEKPLPFFRLLRQIADRHLLSECCMGMSSDYHIAIDEGSTSIRIGRKIFGETDEHSH